MGALFVKTYNVDNVDEGRKIVSAIVKGVITGRRRKQEVIQAPTGLGKTVTVLLEVQDALLKGLLGSRRVLILVENHELIQELLKHALLTELAAVARVRYGRTRDEDNPGFCRDKQTDSNTSGRLSDNRHFVKPSYCENTGSSRCVFAVGCAYLQHLQDCAAAPIVFAAKAAVANSPSELDTFAIIIVDEDLTAGLWETAVIKLRNANEWRAQADQLRERRRAMGHRNPYMIDGYADRWLRVLHEVLVNHLPASGCTPKPFLQAFRDAAAAINVNADTLLRHIDGIPRDHESASYTDNAWKIPLRIHDDLGDAVKQDMQRSSAAHDSRLHLTPNGIEIRIPCRKQLDVLRRKRLINTDATPCWTKIRRLFPKAGEHAITVPVYQHVTQVHTALYTRKHLERGDTLARISRLLDAITADQHAVVYAPRAFNPSVARNDRSKSLQVSNPNCKICHFGGSSRGTNEHENVQIIVIVGHHVPNLNDIEADTRALRADFGGSSPEPLRNGSTEILWPYGWRDVDGSGVARKVTRSEDREIAALVDWYRTSMIQQVIGRGRPSADTRRDAPLRIVLIAGYPIPEIRIDRLVAIDELEQELRLLPWPGRERHLSRVNTERQSDFIRRAHEAKAALDAPSDGTPSIRQLARLMWSSGGTSEQRKRLAEIFPPNVVPHGESEPPLTCYPNEKKSTKSPNVVPQARQVESLISSHSELGYHVVLNIDEYNVVPHPPSKCTCCHQSHWWRSQNGGSSWRCGVCHPPVRMTQVTWFNVTQNAKGA